MSGRPALVRERELNKALPPSRGLWGYPSSPASRRGRTFSALRIPVIKSAEIHRLEVFAPVRVETLKQLADRVGISLGQPRHLIHSGQLQHVRIGARRFVPAGAWERFITDNTVTRCPDATVAPDYAGSRSASASTSLGPSTAAAASAQLALKSRVETPKQLAQRVGITDGQIYVIGAN
jgi:hypothetical protein